MRPLIPLWYWIFCVFEQATEKWNKIKYEYHQWTTGLPPLPPPPPTYPTLSSQGWGWTYPNGGGPNCRYTCRYSIFCCLTRMGVDLSKWGWTKWIGMPVDIPFSAVYLGSFLFPFVSEKIFHCKPNLAQSLNLYSTHCVDNLSCPW